MDFKHIEAFVKVVELGSFSKAAEALFISQPSISLYISALEKELHAVLLHRSTKAVKLTLAGERFLDKAKEILSLKNETTEMLQNLTGDISGTIRILASSVPSQYILPAMLAGFRERYSKVSFIMQQADTASVVQGIAAHKADIGFAGSMMGDTKCEFHAFASEKLVFIAQTGGSSLSEEKEHTLETLLYSNSFIARESGSGTRIQYEKFFAENGIQIDRIETCASMDSTQGIINAVISGLGISIVSEMAVQNELAQKRLRMIRINKALPERAIYVVLNKNAAHSHVVELFLDYVMRKNKLKP